jgi:hypothetical protein
LGVLNTAPEAVHQSRLEAFIVGAVGVESGNVPTCVAAHTAEVTGNDYSIRLHGDTIDARQVKLTEFAEFRRCKGQINRSIGIKASDVHTGNALDLGELPSN